MTTHDHARHGPADTLVEASHAGAFERGQWTFPGLRIRLTDAPPTSADGVLSTAGTTTFTLHLR